MSHLTTEEIAQQYNVAMAAVVLLNAGKQIEMTDVEWNYVLKKYKDLLESMITQTYWTDQDLKPIVDCINNNS
jgi:hypothetical protein